MKITFFFKKYLVDILFVITCTASVLFAYKDLPNVYYMHDEWKTLGDAFINKVPYWVGIFPLGRVLFGRIRLIGTSLNYLIYNAFPFQSTPFIVFAYFFHVGNCILLSYILRRLTKNKFIWYVAPIFFAIASTSQQSISWLGAGIETLGSAFFVLVSIYMCLSYVKFKKPRFLLISTVFLYIAYLFKETAIILLPFIIFSFIKNSFSKLLLTKKNNWVFIVILFTSTALVFIYLFIYLPNGILHNEFILTGKNLLNIVYYPIVSLAQCFIPDKFTYRLSTIFLNINYPIIATYNDAPTITYFIVADVVSLLLSIVIGVFLYIVFINTKEKRILILSFVWYFLSFVPVAFALPQRNSSYIDSRLLYNSMISVSIWFACIFSYISKKLEKISSLLTPIFFFLLVLVIYKQMTITMREVKGVAITGKQMTTFIASFKKYEVNYEGVSKPVYYFSSDKNFFYNNNKLPFLLGSGYIISLLDYPSGRIPKEALKNEFLVDFGAQGYIEDKTKGYGYYYDYQELLKSLQDNLFNVDQVIAYRFDSNTNKVSDITDKIRQQLRSDKNVPSE